ncbi:Folic acid and derivative biosynthetic process isoform 2 [Theobroma cacao]|uniref:Folic acid and derivative biosynthetic process isoform 2 n=1 Tax=Theobroma cacao TaxID=3641 RepID=A0A061EWT7_THECC|nr:Folic acid and derivative biosynthetic process isoform 2 [Theobroma cacao]
MEEAQKQKMKILCLHGFRTSGSFLHKQISKWDPSVFCHFDMDFPDGLFPAGGKSDIEGIFPPPYFEWFQFNKDFTEYTNLEECVSHLCEYITTKGPFHGLLGFSQVRFILMHHHLFPQQVSSRLFSLLIAPCSCCRVQLFVLFC